MKLTILIVRFLEELNGVLWRPVLFNYKGPFLKLHQITPHCHVALKSY